MRCPVCSGSTTLGILTRHRDKEAGLEIATLFCSRCCVEFTVHNGTPVQVTTISADGEITTFSLRGSTHDGLRDGLRDAAGDGARDEVRDAARDGVSREGPGLWTGRLAS